MSNDWDDTTLDGDWKKAPDLAPYPRHWTPDMRVDMTWYAARHRIVVPYDPRVDDEGASGWLPAYDRMVRDRKQTLLQRQLTAAGSTLALEPPEPQHVPDPAEPRHPRQEFEDW